MKRLIIWIVALTVLFSGGIAFAKQSGRIASQPILAEWFTYPDGKPCPMPCLFGIRLGVTTLDEAEIILQQHPKIKITQRFGESSVPSSRAYILNGFGSSYLELVLETDPTNGAPEIEKIVLHTNKEPEITFYDVLLTLGYPEAVFLDTFENTSAGGSDYAYFNKTVWFWLDVVRPPRAICQIDLEDQVGIIMFHSQKFKRNNFVGAETFYPWAGLTKETYWERYYKYERNIEQYDNCDQWRSP